MGCHTWCYAHIPEKKDEWNKEFLDTAKKSAEWMLNHLKTEMTDKDFQGYVDEEIEQDKNWLKCYLRNVKEDREADYLPYFDNDIDKLHEYADSIRKKKKKYQTAAQLKNEWIKKEENLLKDIEECTDAIELIHKHPENTYITKFGLFMVRDGKMYRETSHYRGPKYGENYVFEKQFGDMFRIYDYEAKDCHSLEETLERCEEYEVDWEECYHNDPTFKINDKDKVIEFWKTYPDGIITFG